MKIQFFGLHDHFSHKKLTLIIVFNKISCYCITSKDILHLPSHIPCALGMVTMSNKTAFQKSCLQDTTKPPESLKIILTILLISQKNLSLSKRVALCFLLPVPFIFLFF